jgi:hypothetical protein
MYLSSNLVVLVSIFLSYLSFIFHFHFGSYFTIAMEQVSEHRLSFSFERPPSEHPIHTSNYELSPPLIDLA